MNTEILKQIITKAKELTNGADIATDDEKGYIISIEEDDAKLHVAIKLTAKEGERQPSCNVYQWANGDIYGEYRIFKNEEEVLKSISE